MHLCTALHWGCSKTRARYTGFETSDTSTYRSSIVRLVQSVRTVYLGDSPTAKSGSTEKIVGHCGSSTSAWIETRLPLAFPFCVQHIQRSVILLYTKPALLHIARILLHTDKGAGVSAVQASEAYCRYRTMMHLRDSIAHIPLDSNDMYEDGRVSVLA